MGWITLTQLTRSASRPIATGCARPLGLSSRFGILKARTWLRNSSLRCLATLLRLVLHNVCPWLGLLMVKLFSLVILTTRFACGRCRCLQTAKYELLFCYAT